MVDQIYKLKKNPFFFYLFLHVFFKSFLIYQIKSYKNLFCILAAMNYSEIEFENYSKFVKEFKNKAFQSILSKNFLHPELEALQFVSILIMIFEYTEKEHIKEQICALLAILCQMIIKNIVDNSINFELNTLMPIQYLLDFLKERHELIKNVSLLKIM